MVVGRIANPETVRQITRSLRHETAQTRENLMPVFDEMGQVLAYERAMDPAQLDRLERDTNLARMIGVWRGRQVEEAKAGIFNQTLVDRLYDMWKADKDRGKSEIMSGYVNLMSEKAWTDPVLADAMKLVSLDAWRSATTKFGNGEFWVRRDMLNDVFGYRKASIGDAWTGISRWSPEKQEQVRKLALGVMGNDATTLSVKKFDA